MKLNNDIIELFTLFKKYNYQLFIIGGAVRDYLLKRKIEDYDFATDATPSEMIEILKGYKIDTYQALLGSIKVHLNKKVYEITTFRKDIGVKDLRYPNEIVFVKNLCEDVQRRDFTINTLAYNVDLGVVDSLNAINDLNMKQIKFVKNTIESIKEDPIRLIRALRFSLLLGFEINEVDLELFYDNASLVNELGKIKYDELFKLVKIEGCKSFIIKYFNVYKKAYPQLDNIKFIDILKSDIQEELLKYILIYYFNDESLLNLNKCDRVIIDGIRKIDIFNGDLYYTKLLIIEYKEKLDLILDLLNYLGYDVSKIIENVGLIRREKHPLSINELQISYLDLEMFSINKKYYTKIFKYLLDQVLHDSTLNTKEKLISLINEQKGDF